MSWTARLPELDALSEREREGLDRLGVMRLSRGDVVFRPGDSVQGYALVLDGQIDVSLTGASGREILLYSVRPGQSCIQSTLGLLGSEDYSAEATARSETELVLIPKARFLDLIDRSTAFRGLVFNAFADRMQTMMHLLEKVAFQKLDTRLAERLLDLAQGSDRVRITHADLASQIGSSREVVSRRLERWARAGYLTVSRGEIALTDPGALRAMAAEM